MPLTDLLERTQRLQAAGQGDGAAALYEQWIASTDSPYRHVAGFNRGTVLSAAGRHAEAEAAYRQALALQPGFAQARVNLGHQLEQLGRHDEAIAEWQVVRDQYAGLTPQSDPTQRELYQHAINNQARLLETLRHFERAEALMRESLLFNPRQPDVVQHYVHIRQKQCKWPLYEAFGEVTLNMLLTGTSALAMLNVSDDPALQLLAAQRFVHDKVPKPPVKPLYNAERPANPRIRIGYLSGDLCLHAVGLLTPELLELHDRERFEVVGLDWSRDDGTPQRARLLRAMDQHVRLHALSDEMAARVIASQNIDVLVDLQGLTSGARPAILGYRAAPHQVGYLGLPATSGLPGVGHMLADPYVMPSEYLPYCTEQALYVPHCYQVSDRQREVGAIPTRVQAGLPDDDRFVFCSFNNNHKFTEGVFAAWMRVLQQVPHSVMWLLADNEWSRANMLAVAQAHGVSEQRLIFAPRVAPPDYLARMALADLFLDTFPYNAGTTASDALWMGTPILTLSGRSYISRMAGSLLTSVGLPDLITTTLADYEQLAVTIGRNPGRAASYKRYLREQGRQSKLFDLPARVRDIEAAFERLVQTPGSR